MGAGGHVDSLQALLVVRDQCFLLMPALQLLTISSSCWGGTPLTSRSRCGLMRGKPPGLGRQQIGGVEWAVHLGHLGRRWLSPRSPSLWASADFGLAKWGLSRAGIRL